MTPELLEIGRLRLESEAGLAFDLLAETGERLASVHGADSAAGEPLDLDLAALQPGTYVVRVGREVAPAERFDPGEARRPLDFRLTPGW